MKEKAAFLLTIGWLIVAILLVAFRVPGPYLQDNTEGAIFRMLLVFSPINGVLLLACAIGYFQDTRLFHRAHKYPFSVLAILVLDLVALATILLMFVEGAGVLSKSNPIQPAYWNAGCFVMLLTLPLLALYKDSLSPTSILRSHCNETAS